MEKFCQSCGMPLSPTNQGREQDGTKSTQYCQLCYVDGQWTEPAITFDQMLAKGIAGIRADQTTGQLKRWFLIKSYPLMLKKMRRWQ